MDGLRRSRSILRVLWPAFFMAGVLEVLVFAVVDPATLSVGGSPVGWSRQAVYTVAFFAFWIAIALASAVSHWLDWPADVVNSSGR